MGGEPAAVVRALSAWQFRADGPRDGPSFWRCRDSRTGEPGMSVRFWLANRLNILTRSFTAEPLLFPVRVCESGRLTGLALAGEW